LTGAGAASAQAPADGIASAWTAQKYGPMRLISGVPNAPGVTPVTGKLYAGIHIKLDSGWKTYWRVPGDSGVPPQIDWAGSANVGAIKVLYPTPIRLPEAGMISLGYKLEVVLPVEITPADPTKPVTLKLAAEYGVCKDICIPAEAKLELGLSPVALPGEGALIGRYLVRVPLATAASTPALKNFTAELSTAQPRIAFEAVFPKGSDGADAVIEIAGGELAPLPVITERVGRDVVRFEARFASPSEAKRFAGKPVTVTLISAAGQSEATAQVP
jgi:DsbC/DsbD-like thiol-disulfide interchange protein